MPFQLNESWNVIPALFCPQSLSQALRRVKAELMALAMDSSLLFYTQGTKR